MNICEIRVNTDLRPVFRTFWHVPGWTAALVLFLVTTLPTGLQASSPSKEYIRQGGRLIAIEFAPAATFMISRNSGTFTHSVTANVGDTITYQWSSARGTSYASFDTISPNNADGCGNTTGPAGFNSAGGTSPAYSLVACQSGYTYTMTYTVTAANTAMWTDTITIHVN